MKKKNLKLTLAVAVMGVSATLGYASYSLTQNQQFTFANPLMEENINALAERTGWWGGWVDECVKVFTATKKDKIYDSASSSTNVSTSTNNSVGGNYNPVTQDVGGNISNSNSVSYGGSNSGQHFMGETVDCKGLSGSHCHMGDCTKYESGKGFTPTYPDCAAKLK